MEKVLEAERKKKDSLFRYIVEDRRGGYDPRRQKRGYDTRRLFYSASEPLELGNDKNS